ncbi:MAG: metalloregulator ArsR/SmtB family transcription factor [ANME-2 cluster archaeon]|nr:metalloregulator ArsR/SmtB family transcription factor [ANME-2 cluster archaeon]
MNEQCQCESRTADICCPVDEKLRKEWLLNLEKDHIPVKHVSKEITRKLKLFSNSHRIEILLMLEQREHCMDEIAKKLKAKKSAVSYHLGLLQKHDIICKVKRSRFAFYSISKEGKRTISMFREL